MTSIAGRPVNRVGFGAMQLPGPGVFGPPRDRNEALGVLRRAVALGVNHIDTAQYYGPDVANELIRAALHPYPDDLVLVSKVGAARDRDGGWISAQRPAQLRKGVEENLRSLAIERIDVVNLRLLDPQPRDANPATGVPFADQLGELVELREEGKIGGIGLSNVTTEQVQTGIAYTRIACVQNPMSLVQRADDATLELCGEAGIPYVPFFPLGSAFPHIPHVASVPAVQEVAARLDATPAQVALAWLLQRGPHVLLIPGTSRIEHLEENLGAAALRLDDDAMAQLDRC